MSDNEKNPDDNTSGNKTPDEKISPVEKRLANDTVLIDNVEQDPVYYYSREHRLSRASAQVRAHNEGTSTRPGLSKSLFGTRGNIFLFVSIIIICAMFGMTSRFSGRESPGVKLGGNTLALTIFREEEILIFELLKNAPKSGNIYTGEVDIAVSPVMPKSDDGAIPDVFSHRVYFHPAEYESFNIALPFFEEDNFVVLIIAGEEQRALRLNVKGN